MKRFNTTASCIPDKHYMVDITGRLQQIKTMIDCGDYFTINRSRQYGKTTTLQALEKFVQSDYLVINLDFQEIGKESFQSEGGFAATFSRRLTTFFNTRSICPPEEIRRSFISIGTSVERNIGLDQLFDILKHWCSISDKPIVLIIDEVDVAAGFPVFLDFLSQLRSAFINRETVPTFQSVILAGVTDVKHLKRRIRDEDEVQMNSPWNIAVPFKLDMSFSKVDIISMLKDYTLEHQFQLDLSEIAKEIHNCTSGYPFLVSRMCQIIDEELMTEEYFDNPQKAWASEGIMLAFKKLVEEKNTLFESIINKLYQYPELNQMVNRILFQGERISYNALNPIIEQAEMYGFVKGFDGTVCITNRVFETILYNFFLTSQEAHDTEAYRVSTQEGGLFIKDGRLDMRRVLEKFAEHYGDIYGKDAEKFIEEDGRKLFLLYLKPIINGVGNYYIEAQTRDQKRTDVVVDYHGEQFVIELKIWRGNSYNERGEAQLIEYLDYFHLNTGYMLSFNFNKEKEIGVKTIRLHSKELIEAVV